MLTCKSIVNVGLVGSWIVLQRDINRVGFSLGLVIAILILSCFSSPENTA